MSKKLNATLCPFCNSKNQCMAQAEQLCWCNNIDIPEELINLLPEAAKGKSCICSSCINSFKENPDKFRKNISSGH